MSERKDNAAIWANAVEKALHDPEFRQRLLSNTHQTLIELGGQPEPGVTYSIVVDTVDHRYLVLPHHSTIRPVDPQSSPHKCLGF
jgi:hypothetical protein